MVQQGREASRASAFQLAMALWLLTAAPVADAKKKPKKTQREITVEFTEPGPLGLDFSLEKLPGGKFGLAIKGIADDSQAAAFSQLKPGMRLLSVDDHSGGVVVKTEIKASSPQDLSSLAKTALGDARPVTVHFAVAPKKAIKGDAAALIREGTRLGQMGQIPEALAAMERAVTLKPDMPEAQYNLGIGYDRAGRSPEAVVAFQKALKLKPSLPKPMALTLWETAQAQSEHSEGGGDVAAEQLCDADLATAHRLTETHHVATVLTEAEASAMIDSVRADAGRSGRKSDQVVFTHPVFTYYDTAANPTGQPAILETSSEYTRATLEIARDLYSSTYDKLSAAVSAANEQTWGFQGLVSSSMVQHMVAYDAGGDQNTLVGGWWTGGNYNTTTHSKGRKGVELIEYYHTYLQLSLDSDCGGGLVIEIAGGSVGSDDTDSVLSLPARNVTLSQGQVAIVPSYVVRRPLPVSDGTCEVAEGTFVGTDVSGRHRSAAVLVALEQAVAAQPQRQQQLRTVLQNNSDYMPLLTQAFNSHELPKLSTSPSGFEVRDVPPTLLQELLEHYETNAKADDSCNVATAEDCISGNGLVNETVAGNAMHGHPKLVTPLVDKAPGGVLLQSVERQLRPVLEEWVTDVPLVLQRCHGIREYTEGGYLKRHIDWPLSHVVAVIINLAQDVAEPWPLVIEDHDGLEHEVIMKPGEMVLYESARLVHGRPYPLQGRSYTNLFVHFKPAEKWEAQMLGDPRWQRQWS